MKDKRLLHFDLVYDIVGAAQEVHTVLGPGFLESVYETALQYELMQRGLATERQVVLPVVYKEIEAGTFIADLVVERKVIVELKVAATLNRAHLAQAINYLTATGYQVALLMNFGAESLEFKRVIKSNRASSRR